MSRDYGRPANPEAFIIAALAPLGLPALPERDLEGDSEGALPFYLVTAVAARSNRFLLCATVSVHTFAATRADASAAAWNADNTLISLTAADVLTLPDGSQASAWVDPVSPPTFADYRDPFIKRYVARYDAQLRFTATT